ncbi:amidase [soil metagenome]
MDTVSEICTKTLTEAAGLIKSREVSPVELTRSMLERIETVDRELHSYITVASDFALKHAQQAEQEISKGDYRGPLHGVPLAVKDLIFTKDVRTTCASKILSEWVPDHNATVIERLYEAGAVLLGKLTLTEFAGVGYHPSVPPALNPWDANRWTGSSSSGSGVAMAASLCFGTLGTDTGGSIRFPSAACGVVGVKPTYGKVSRYGVFPLADSLDHVGPLTRRVEDAALILQAIAGFDRNDPTTRRERVPDYLEQLKAGVRGVRIGVDWSFCTNRVDPEISEAITAACKLLSDLGARIEETKLSGIEEAPAAWGVIFSAECAVAHEATYPSRAEDYSPPFRGFLQESEKIRGTDYVKAVAARQRVSRMIDDQLQIVDLLLCPTIGMVPMKLNGTAPEEIITPEVGNDLLSLTSPFSLSGNPTISLPCGFSRDGLPLSLQMIGRHAEEGLIMQAGYAYEEATEWHKLLPPI